jgi:large subunit ribosomal protein L6
MDIAANPSQPKTSRVGKRPVDLPKGVTAAINKGALDIKGPKGQLSRALAPSVAIKVEGNQIVVTSDAPGRDASRLQGTGYRVELKGTTLHFALGFSHPVVFPVPKGLTANIPADSKGTILVLNGADKELIGQTAAKIRGFRPPEPYKGKGVRYKGERVREKAGKAGKGGKK